MTDEELMHRVRAGDEASFCAIYDRYKVMIYQYIYRWVGRQWRAEELTQEVFVGLWRSRDTFRAEASIKTYLFTIARNLCASESRRPDVKRTESIERNDDEAPREFAAQAPRQDEELSNRQEAELVRLAVERLEHDHREVIVLREFQGLSYQEIADVLGVELGTVKSRIFRAKMELKRLLEEYFGEPANRVAARG